MKLLRIACTIVLLSLLTGSIGPAYAAPSQVPHTYEWTPLVPPGSVSGTFTYGPEGRKPHAFYFRIPHSGGPPGEWQAKLVPQDNQAAYYYWAGRVNDDDEPKYGETYDHPRECEKSFYVASAGYPSSGDDWDQGIQVYADFEMCGEAGRNATSSFTIEWELVSSPEEPTETPTPTDTPVPLLGCQISVNASPTHILPGQVSTVTVVAKRSDGSPIANAKVDAKVSAGPGMLVSGTPYTDQNGRYQFDYRPGPDIGSHTQAKISIVVSGCNEMQSVTINFGPTPTPTLTPTHTNTPKPDAPLEPPTKTPTPTLTPVPDLKSPGTLEISELILLQAIEDGVLIGGRDIGLRAYFEWNGAFPITVEGVAVVDGTEIARRQKQVNKLTYIDLILPGTHFGPWSEMDHTLEFDLTVQSAGGAPASPPVSAGVVDTFRTYPGRPFNVFYVSINPAIQLPQINQLADAAKRFYDQVYPVPFTNRVRNAAYLVEQKGLVSFLELSWLISLGDARDKYNGQRCRDASGALKTDCVAPKADLIVGIFKEGDFGAGVHGFTNIFTRHLYRAVTNSHTNSQNVAHEIGHQFTLFDEYNDSVSGIYIPQGTHVMINGKIQVAGYQQFINFMGNAGVDPTWVNHDTWNMLLHLSRTGRGVSEIPSGDSAPHQARLIFPSSSLVAEEIEGNALLVNGLIEADGSARFLSTSWLPRYTPQEFEGDTYRLEAVDRDGNLLSSCTLDIPPIELSDLEVQATPFTITLPIEDPDAVTQITLYQDGVIAAEQSRSPSAPSVAFNPLPALDSGQATISWSATDPDGDSLRSDVFYSSDGGEVWQVLAVNLEQQNLAVDPQILSGGQAQFKVIISDGLNEATAASEPVVIVDKTPQAFIAPIEDGHFYADSRIVLFGSGYDLEDGEVDELQLEWFDASGTRIGIGRLLDLTGLAPGEYRYTLKASDLNGQADTAEATFTVLTPVVEKGTSGSPSLLGTDMVDMLIVGCICLVALALAAIVVVLLIGRKRPGAHKTLYALVPLLIISMVGTVVFALKGGQSETPSVSMETTSPQSTTAAPPTLSPPTSTPQPTATPTPTLQPTEAPPFVLSTQTYMHPDQLFELTPPEGWTVSQIEGGSVFVEPDGEGQITIQANNTGQVLDADAFTLFVEASELNGWAGIEGYTELEREIDGASGVASIAKSFSLEGQRYTVVSIYNRFEGTVYGYDFWALESEYDGYGPLYDTLLDSLSLYYDNAATLPLYHNRYTFQNVYGLYEVDVPVSWLVQYDEGDNAVVDTFFSPDQHAVLQNIAYDDSQPISKSMAGQMALNLLNAYYAQDIVITEDTVMTDGSERLIWYSPGNAYQGQSFFETRGTTFLLLTLMYDDPYADFYNPIMGGIVGTYRVP